MTRIGVFILAMLVAIALTGCAGRAELREMSIVAGLGVDRKGEDQIEVTTQMIVPGKVRKGEPDAVLVDSTIGYSVFEAVRDFIIKTGRKQFWQHVQSFVIGEDIAREGVTPIIDFLNRDHEPRLRMHPFVSLGSAKDIMLVKTRISNIPSTAIKESLENQKNLAKAPEVELHEFNHMLMTPYRDPYLPVIRKSKEDFEISGTALFKEDRMVGMLTPRETRGMLRVLGKVEGGLQIVKYIPENSEEPNYLSIEIKKSSSKLEAIIMNNKPKIRIDIEETAFLSSMTQPISKKELNYKLYEKFEKAYADTVKKEVEHAVEKIQKEYKSHIFDFSGTINRKDKKVWKQISSRWEEIYPTLPVEVHVKTHIPENQLIKNNPGDKKK